MVVGLLTKDERTKKVMLRVTDSTIQYIDNSIGDRFASRPDYVIHATRVFLQKVIAWEVEAVLKVHNKEISHTEKVKFYKEYLSIAIHGPKNEYLGRIITGKESCSILLSLPTGLLRDIEGVVDRTGLFKNHHEFIKIALEDYSPVLNNWDLKVDVAGSFQNNPSDLAELRDELDKFKREMRVR